MSTTLCLYEHPAALHMIEDWRRDNDFRIIGTHAKPGKPSEGARFDVTMEGGEVVSIYGVVNGKIPRAAVTAAKAADINKLLFFGKVPIKEARWYLLQQLCLGMVQDEEVRNEAH